MLGSCFLKYGFNIVTVSLRPWKLEVPIVQEDQKLRGCLVRMLSIHVIYIYIYIYIYFLLSGFSSQKLTVHRTAGEGRGHQAKYIKIIVRNFRIN